MAKYALGLDLGTSSLHCLLVDRHNQPVAGADAPLQYYCPDGAPPLAREFHPGQVLASVGRLVRETCRQAGIAGHEVAALGVTSQGQGMVLLDRDGREMYCGPNIDLRAVFEGAVLDEESGPEIYQITGHCPSLLLAPARLRWFKSHQPALMERASSATTIAGWLVYRLTGQVSAEEGLDATLGLVDMSTRKHALQLLERLGCPTDLLPPLARAGEQLGCLCPELAEDWGLPAGLPVTLGGVDTQCGLLGLGLTSAGQVAAVLGWSGSVQMLTSTPKPDPGNQRTWVGCYPIGALYTVEATLGDAGHAYDWLLRTLSGGCLSYQGAESLANQASPGCDGVLSFLGPGPLTAPSAGLRLGGIMMPTPFTFQETTPAQMVRSYLESVAYSIKANLDTLSEVAGKKAHCLFLGGSLAQSGVLATTLASLLAMPVNRGQHQQITALGAAAAAWVSAGSFSSLEEAMVAQPMDYDVFLPEPALTGEYIDYYHRWVDTFHRVSPES